MRGRKEGSEGEGGRAGQVSGRCTAKWRLLALPERIGHVRCTLGLIGVALRHFSSDIDTGVWAGNAAVCPLPFFV